MDVLIPLLFMFAQDKVEFNHFLLEVKRFLPKT